MSNTYLKGRRSPFSNAEMAHDYVCHMTPAEAGSQQQQQHSSRCQAACLYSLKAETDIDGPTHITLPGSPGQSTVVERLLQTVPGPRSALKVASVLGVSEDKLRSVFDFSCRAPLSPISLTTHDQPRSTQRSRLASLQPVCAMDPPSTGFSRSRRGPFSPHSLRNMRSKFNMSVDSLLKKSSPSGLDRPSIPSEEGASSIGGNLHSTISIQQRRGVFRPLSIITNAVNFPFDPLSAMDEHSAIQATADQELRPNQKEPPIPEETEPREMVVSSEKDSSDHPRSLLAQKVENKENVITGDFATLASTPQPLLNDHPMYRSDPFSVNHHYPLMISTTSSAEIRQHAGQHDVSPIPRDRAPSSGENLPSGSSNTSTAKKKLYQLGEKLTPIKGKRASTEKGSDLSPLAKSRVNTQTSLASDFSNLTITPARTSPTSEEKRHGLRKVSMLFKPRSSSDRSNSSGSLSPPENPNLNRPDLVWLPPFNLCFTR